MRKRYLLIFVFCWVAMCLLLRSKLSGQETTTRIQAAETSSPCDIVAVYAGPLSFESGKTYYVHPEALENVTQITLEGLLGTTIHFLAPLKGDVTYWASSRDDSGVLNVVDCVDLTLTGLDIENTRVYTPGNIILESSCAVNISASSVEIRHSKLKGNGKSALAVHSGSEVLITDSEISAYYFEMLVAASDLTAERVILNQLNPQVPDSHAAIWVSSSHRHDSTNVLYENTNVVLTDVTFNLESGRAIVSGNGSYTTMSNVTLTNPTYNFTDPTHGIATFHENYNSITVVLNDPIEGLVDYVTTPNTGFGRFVNYYTPATRPNSNSPIVVDGVSSEDIQL